MHALKRGAATTGFILLATFIITTPFILMAGANPFSAYGEFLVKPLTSRFTLLEVLVSSIPLIFTGVAVAFAFRAGYWNIGAEGQLLMGAVAAAGIGMSAGDLPRIVVLPMIVLGGAVAGALWALVPALLRVKLGIDEVVTTLLLNPVALLVVTGLLNGPWGDPETGFPESERIADSAQFPTLLPRSRLHLGFLIGLAIAGVLWFVMSRTVGGLRIRAAGLSPNAARFAGIDVGRTLLVAALISGAVAGIAGASEISGIQYRLTTGVSPGFGYTGIVVATLGALSMPTVVLAALLFGDLTVGAGTAGRVLGIPSQLGDVVQATVLLVTVGVLAYRRVRQQHRPIAATGQEPIEEGVK
ncbi:MAG: ABC transporter permease [Acidimicrobiia bacterium]|nr:ABC transporter permease [Acidimicrobiia bacterium]MDX2465708.1 ABC transporter permease [Acidimicrobiia bacterium]